MKTVAFNTTFKKFCLQQKYQGLLVPSLTTISRNILYCTYFVWSEILLCVAGFCGQQLHNITTISRIYLHLHFFTKFTVTFVSHHYNIHLAKAGVNYIKFYTFRWIRSKWTAYLNLLFVNSCVLVKNESTFLSGFKLTCRIYLYRWLFF